MRRCSRPTCQEYGVVAVAFDAGNRVAALEAPTEWSALVFCRVCADRFTLPGGWTWLDGGGQLAFFPELTTDVETTPSLELVAGNPPATDQLELFRPPPAIDPELAPVADTPAASSDPAAPTEVIVDDDPFGESVLPTEPDPSGWSWPFGLDGDPIDELTSVDESTPLLARAFRASRAS
ncbi:MAG: hypothetical protein GY745_00280 [Actinomycetia bacterium]|nr:hypothetical protein [Actinomycetes bacterium]MCP4083484.1 hypothetical protein [Actinomycetes bacterium]